MLAADESGATAGAHRATVGGEVQIILGLTDPLVSWNIRVSPIRDGAARCAVPLIEILTDRQRRARRVAVE